MSRTRIFPHPVAAKNAIGECSWSYAIGGSHRRPVNTAIEGWDYATHLTIWGTFSVDPEVLESSTGLQLAEIEAIASVDCPAVAQRFIGVTTVTSNTVEVAVEIPPHSAADDLKLSMHLVTGSVETDSLSASARMPMRRGSRLHSSSVTTTSLEGTGSRFPSEVLPFSAYGLGSAPWTVSTYFAELDESFMGTVRLLVNSEHPFINAVSATLAEAPVIGQMRVDVTRMLIAEAARSGDTLNRAEWPDDSVGAVLEGLCDFYLNKSLSESIQLYKSHPVEFERQLHNGFTIGSES